MKKTGLLVLPKHKSWNYIIELVSDETPKFKSLYKTSAIKLKFLKKYLNEIFSKNYIRKFKSSALSLIIFISKLNKKEK